jgi:hypothetical protein
MGMQKGDEVGNCRYCARPVLYPGHGPAPVTCRRKECRRRRSREQTAAHRKRVLDGSTPKA